MKNSLFLLGAAAVVALSSCTKNEVLEVAENRAIGFDAFVNNNTRAEADVTSDKIAKFWVFGGYEQAASTWVDFYTNVQVDRRSWWK